jgi:hypothetical protein
MKMRGDMPGWIGRREPEAVSLPGTIILRNGRSVAITVVDLSPEGCRVECEEALPIAATVQLKLGGATANAQVRWARPGTAGLQLI